MTTDPPLVRDIHSLVRRVGRNRAHDLVPREQKHLVDLAAAMAAEETQELGITYSGFALTALPHKRLRDEEPWERHGQFVSLLIEPGRLPTRNGPRLYGVPFGSRARMILFYLQKEAVKTKSREIEIGRSMHEWLERISVPTGGQGYRDVREQAARIAACRLTFSWLTDKGLAFEKDAIVKGGLNLDFTEQNRMQRTFWQETVFLSEAFYNQLCAHPVPLWEQALKKISSNSATLDVYVWLAYRLHNLRKPTPVSWIALFDQFGAGYTRVRDFRKRFLETLKIALAVYEEASVTLDNRGIVLHPSPPPIAKIA